MGSAVISDSYPAKLERIDNYNFPIARILDKRGTVRISQKLPFYVRFENVGISGYGPSSPAPIGIAVIGKNNYIL
jgi:hypothetical protein